MRSVGILGCVSGVLGFVLPGSCVPAVPWGAVGGNPARLRGGAGAAIGPGLEISAT